MSNFYCHPGKAGGFPAYVKVIDARYLGEYRVSLAFSDGKEGIFDGRELLKKNGPLLDALRSESYFQRLFIDAGALCWPNGLELSPARLYESCKAPETVA